MADGGTYRSFYVRMNDHLAFQRLSPRARHALKDVKMLLPFWGLGKLWAHELAYTTGWSEPEMAAALDELEAGGWIEREGPWTWLRNGLRHEPNISLTNAKHLVAIRNALRDVPRLLLLARFLEHYPEIDDGAFGPFPDSPTNSLPDSHADTLRQAQSRNTEQEEKIVSSNEDMSKLNDISTLELAENPEPVPKWDAEVRALWDVWLAMLGGKPPHPRLTDKRRACLRMLWVEQLRARDGPGDVFRQVLEAVKRSDFHMSQRAYQMPESLFRNAERRDRWVNVAMNGSGLEGLTRADRKLLRQRQELEGLRL